MTRSTGGLSRQERKRTKRGPGGDLSDIQSPLMNLVETCAYTRLARSVLYERLHEFDVVRLGKRRFITKASCDRYIERNTKPARASQTTQPAATAQARSVP
jgi:hypothetical protein